MGEKGNDWTIKEFMLLIKYEYNTPNDIIFYIYDDNITLSDLLFHAQKCLTLL